MNLIEDKDLIDFYHNNTTNYKDQILNQKGSTYGYNNNLIMNKHPNDINMESIPFSDILPTITSKRDMLYSSPLKKEELLNLLYNSFRFEGGKSLKSPSPGRIYPIELYIIVNNMEGVKNGTYIYNREEISLQYLNSFSDIHSINVPNNDFTRNVSCMIFMVGKITNLIKKYGARAYRYCLIECGHLGQNLSIVSHRLNIKSCSIGGFYDTKVSNRLNLDDSLYPLYAYVFGK